MLAHKLNIQDVLKDIGFSEFVSIDLETTGLNSDKDEIIEVSAIKFINGLGVSNIKSHEDSLLHHLTEKLIKIDGLKIYGSSQNKAAILSFNIDGLHHYDIGVLLDKMGIAIRTGHHCTQPIMEKYNILGTARVSLSVYNTIEEIDYFISAIRRIKNMLS